MVGQKENVSHLGATYWWVVAVAAVFTLARFSEAFLLLRAQSIGLPVALIPIVLVIMSLAYSVSAYPIGVLSDRVNRLTLLAFGLVFLLLADLVLAFAADIIWVGIGVMLWGLHMGFTQGLLTTLIAETAPAELRGTAFGMFNLVTGVALLIASLVAGALGRDGPTRHIPGGSRLHRADPRRIAPDPRSVEGMSRCLNTDGAGPTKPHPSTRPQAPHSTASGGRT